MSSVPIPNSYWVRPGQFLAGEYPSAQSRDVAEQRLRALLDAGVTHFVDLTSEDDPLEPYEELLRSTAAARDANVVYARRAIGDLSCPTVDEMRAILDEIDAVVEAGHTVYVHCWGGVGRTGTVVGCHLVRHGFDGYAALEEVARLFQTMSEQKLAANPHSPETTAQREFVRRWTEGAPA